MAAEDAAAVATFYAARERDQWALRAGTGKTAAEVRAEASERARAAMWGAGATMAAVTAYVEAYAAAATGAFVHAEARALAKDRDDAAAAVISAFIGEVVAATRRDAASAALAEVAEASSTPDPKAAAWKPFEEFAAEVVAVIDAAGGSMLASKLPAAYEAKYGRRWISRPSASRRCRRSRRASRASASATATTPRRRCLPPKTTSFYRKTARRSSAAFWRSSTRGGGLVTLNGFQRLYKDHATARKLDHAALGFGQLAGPHRSLRGVRSA